MTLQDIMDRLTAEGYSAFFSGSKNILIPGKGEVELAYGEAKLFDAKHPWPDYGNHPCIKNIDALFDDIHATWPLETKCETSSSSSPSSSAADAPATATRAAARAPATAAANDPEPVEQEGVPAGTDAPAVRAGVDDEPAVALGS